MKAVWHIISFQDNSKSPNVTRLQINDENEKSYQLLDSVTPEEYGAIRLQKCFTLKT